jgi:arylsulfatase A-like enzyme
MNRRDFLRFAAVASATSLSAQRMVPQPNVVLILSDDQGYGDIGCYGTEADPRTPQLDALAASGVRFTNFYANAPMCSPTRAALLTGRYPYRCGVPFVLGSEADVVGLKGDEVTLAETLTEAGYRTGLIGKWHLGTAPQSLPNSQGFADFYGFRSGCIDYFSHRYYWGLGAGRPSFHDLYRNAEEIDESGQYATHLITRESVRFIEENRAKPFFLFVSYSAPHYPMHAPKQYLERFKHVDDPDRAMHLAMIAAMDDGIGEIVAALGRNGLREKTLIFFQSDNGATHEDRAGDGGRNTPFRGYKFSLFEGGIRMPAIANWPGIVPAGKVRAQMAASMDLFPTLTKLCGGKLPRGPVIDGRDIWPMIVDGARSPHESLFWKRYDQVAVRKGPWKLVKNAILALGEENQLQGDDRTFLANLDGDPGESRNLAKDRPEILSELENLARTYELDVGGGT